MRKKPLGQIENILSLIGSGRRLSFSLTSANEVTQGVWAILVLSEEAGLWVANWKGIWVDRIGRHLIIGTVGKPGKIDSFHRLYHLVWPYFALPAN